jgi:hypothetical protein
MEVVQEMMKEGGNEEDLAKLMERMGGTMPGGGAGEPNASTCTFTSQSLEVSITTTFFTSGTAATYAYLISSVCAEQWCWY